MTDLPLQTRAERAAKRRNKKTAERFPLLAEQLAVSVESQVERLTRQDADNIAYFERLEAGNKRAWERAAERKEIARQTFPADLFAEYERRYQRIYGTYAYKDCGHFAADWWWCALRDMNVPWCWENCPNEFFHAENWHRRAGRCPTCHKPLDPPEPKPAEPEQIKLL
jgi:hypothetical protein